MVWNVKLISKNTKQHLHLLLLAQLKRKWLFQTSLTIPNTIGCYRARRIKRSTRYSRMPSSALGQDGILITLIWKKRSRNCIRKIPGTVGISTAGCGQIWCSCWFSSHTGLAISKTFAIGGLFSLSAEWILTKKMDSVLAALNHWTTRIVWLVMVSISVLNALINTFCFQETTRLIHANLVKLSSVNHV